MSNYFGNEFSLKLHKNFTLDLTMQRYKNYFEYKNLFC